MALDPRVLQAFIQSRTSATDPNAPVAQTQPWQASDLNYQQFQTAMGDTGGIKNYSPIYDYVNSNITSPLHQMMATQMIDKKTQPLLQEYLQNPGYLSQVNDYLTNNTQNFMGGNVLTMGDKKYVRGDKGAIDYTDQYNQYQGYNQLDTGLAAALSMQQGRDGLVQGFDNNYYSNLLPQYTDTSALGFKAYNFADKDGKSYTYSDKGHDLTDYLDWKSIDPSHGALAAQVFGSDSLIKGGDNNLYGKYGLIVGGLDNHSDFMYDREASLVSGAGNDAIYRSLTNPNFSVDDYQMGAGSDFRTADWTNVFSANPELKGYLATHGDGAPSAEASDAEWTKFLHKQMNNSYDQKPGDLSPRPTLLNAVKTGTRGPEATLTGFDPLANSGKDQYQKLLDQYKSYGAYDPVKNITSRQFYDNSHNANWDPILSPTDPILIDKGNGEYETWGRFSKYLSGDFDSKYKTWNHYADVDTLDQWNDNSVPDYAKVGKSAGQYVKKYSGLNSDLKNATWAKDANMGTGFAFSEANKGDYGYAPSTGMLKLKQANPVAQFIGPVLSIASIFFPVLAPFAAAVNVGQGISTGNWGQAIGGVMGMPGLGGAIGGAAGSSIGGTMAGGLSNALGVSSQMGGALLGAGMGGLGAVANGGNFLQGAMAGGLGSYAGSTMSNWAGGGVNPATNALYNPVVGAAVGGLSSSVVNQLIGRGQVDPSRALINGFGGGLNAALK